jgi:membrane-bound metal-dependent hydrolase YbcI (DUF457 family)
MHIPGHLAVALGQHGVLSRAYYPQPIPLKPLLIAGLFPDVVDKAIGYVFHLMPNGRHFAHNIFGLFILTLVVTLVWGRKVGLAWFAGYLGHLLADGRKVPWLFPVKQYQFYPGRLRWKPFQFLKEMIFLVVVLMLYRKATP